MLEKVVKFNKYKHKKSKWISQGIIKSIHFSDNLYKKLKMTDPISPDYTIMQINLKTYNHILKTSIRALKQSYCETLFTKFKNDIRGTWKTINSILNNTNRKKNIPQLFKDNEKIITDKIAIVNKFNTFFTNIGPDLAHNIRQPTNKGFKNYLTINYNHNFKFENVNESTILSIIEKLAPKTSFGFDGLSTKLMKTIKDALIKPLTIIINQMLNTGIFPDKLKIAKISTKHKMTHCLQIID